MLIRCPECGKEISDKSSHCIHCGFPLCNLENLPINDGKIYRIATHGYNVRNASNAIDYLKYLTDKGLFGVERDLRDCSRAIVKGLTYEQAIQVRDTLISMEVNCEICEDDISEERDMKWDTMELDQKIDIESKNIIKCPRCGSTAVMVGNRGVTLTSGFFGASKTMNRCGNCGHKWKPR